MTKRVAVVISCLALASQGAGAQTVPVWCQAINEFITDVENGRSPNPAPLRWILLDTTKRGVETVRRYSLVWPQAEPSELIELEILNHDNFYVSRSEAEKGIRHLRVRPHAGSHWIEVNASAVMPDQYGPDRLPDYETGGGFRIIFDSADGSLDVGILLKPPHPDGKARIDQITLSVRGLHCPPDVADTK